MRERPIPFSGPMVRAVLDERKTVTRRLIKGMALDWLNSVSFTPEYVASPANGLCPYGQPSDRLWVREAWRVPASLDDLSGKQIAEKCLEAGYREPWCPIRFDADGELNNSTNWAQFGSTPGEATPGRYRHARFMPRWASRITLEVTGVRVERLQDITYEQAIAEGIPDPASLPPFPPGVGDGLTPDGYSRKVGRPQREFRTLWESINGAGSWDANPWVWAVQFKRVEQERMAA